MGGRAAYTLATALFVGLVGYFGGFTLLFAVLPQAAMFPILVFVGLEITAQSFHATPTRHYPALALAMLPALAALIVVALKNVFGPVALPDNDRGLEVLQTLRCLANGFLISGLLWAAALAMILDGRLRAAALYFLIAAGCTLLGIIHSPLPDEKIDLPWRVLAELHESHPRFAQAVQFQTPYHWAAAYVLSALVLLGLALGPRGEVKEPAEDEQLPASLPPIVHAATGGEGIVRHEEGV
jgi:AGZA family xanthine/uracil permease-like MFS transporter